MRFLFSNTALLFVLLKGLKFFSYECVSLLNRQHLTVYSRVKLLYQKRFKIKEMVEGEEEDAFWDALGDDEDYVSYLGGIYHLLWFPHLLGRNLVSIAIYCIIYPAFFFIVFHCILFDCIIFLLYCFLLYYFLLWCFLLYCILWCIVLHSILLLLFYPISFFFNVFTCYFSIFCVPDPRIFLDIFVTYCIIF